MRRFNQKGLVVLLALPLAPNLACIHGEKQKLKSNVAASMMAQPQNAGPCLASLFGSPYANCIQWQPNVDAAPTYEFSRQLVFLGAFDHLLHVLDAQTGARFADVETEGRVITEAVFNQERTIVYVGTDKGVVHGFDAFSFERKFSFTADSVVSNNLVVTNKMLIFTSSMGTVYSVDSESGLFNWQLAQPRAKERLRLASNSTIFVQTAEVRGKKSHTIIVPHADGFLSVINADSGAVINKITLGIARANGFPDIVAPLVQTKNKLWVASYDLGLFSLDLGSYQIRDQIFLPQIVQLAGNGSEIFAATPDTLFSLSEGGEIKWKNNFFELKTRIAPLAYPFNRAMLGAKRVFFGTPSQLLINNRRGVLVMGTSLGSIGVFNSVNGQLMKILGNAVGFGPKINWAGPDSFFAISKRGLLMKFHFSDDEIKDEAKALFGHLR